MFGTLLSQVAPPTVGFLPRRNTSSCVVVAESSRMRVTKKRCQAEAIQLAKNQGATLRLVHVLDELILGPGAEAVVYLGNTVDLLREAGEQVVAKAEAVVQVSGLESESVVLEIMGGRAADSIVAEANAWGADLIVLGTHGRRGARRLVMGSDAEEIVRTTPVPVLLVRMVE
jgi:nucleotide-binding universal stress UspA family protein